MQSKLTESSTQAQRGHGTGSTPVGWYCHDAPESKAKQFDAYGPKSDRARVIKYTWHKLPSPAGEGHDGAVSLAHQQP